MSQEHLEVVRAVYDRWARGDFSASLPLFDRNVALVVRSGVPDAGTYLGADGVREYTMAFLDPWESLTIAGESFREAGDTILVAVRQNGIGRGSGAPAELRYFQLWTFRGGRIIRLEVIFSEEEALEAAGLRE
jgi:ketosteroid isomerase-like protein